MEEVKKGKSVDEILAMETYKMSLEEMISMLGSTGDEFISDILKLRLRHEDDTGIPMEEDSIAEQENEMIGERFGSIANRLK